MPSQKSSPGRGIPKSPQAPFVDEGLQLLIGNLEQAICTRLDRIEQFLQRLRPNEQQSPEAACIPPEEFPSSSMLTRSGACISLAKLEACEEDDDLNQGGLVIPRRGAQVAQRAEEEDMRNGIDNLCLRPEWMEGKPMEAVAVLSHARVYATEELFMHKGTEGAEAAHKKAPPWWILLPTSRFRLCWDITMVIIIAHDMAVVPVTMAFETGDNYLSTVVFWPFFVFWTLDIPISFVTGFHKNGAIETRMQQIALNYVLSWFFLDFFLVCATLAEAWSEGEGQGGFLLGRVGKSLRVVRIARSLRVLRFAKLQRISENLADRLQSDYHHILVSICKQIGTIVWLNHFIACSWWALGVNTKSSKLGSWTLGFEDESLGFQYFSSLHWSLTQFTPAGMEVSARNLPERIFSVFVLLFAMVAFSSFLSSITSAMTQLRQLHTNYTSNFSLLQRYLRFHEVPTDLTARILNCVDHQVIKHKHQIHESQVVFLDFLSKSLQMELASHIFAPYLCNHPFFERYADIDPEAMRRICLDAMAPVSLSTDDILFTEGSSCGQLYVLTSGRCLYHTRRRDIFMRNLSCISAHSDAAQTVIQYLETREWCCEISVWCQWEHCGTMVASEMSEILKVDVEAFTSITSSFHVVHRFSARYAGYFVHQAKEHFCAGGLLSDMTVLSMDVIEEMVERAYLKRSDAGSRSAELANKPAPMTQVAGKQQEEEAPAEDADSSGIMLQSF